MPLILRINKLITSKFKSEFNVIDTLSPGIGHAYQARTLWAHRSSFVWMPFLLSAMTCMGTSGSWTQACLGASPWPVSLSRGCCVPNKLSLSVLMAIFRVNLVSQCLLKQRMMEVVVTTGAVSRAKCQSNHHLRQTNIQFFYRPDALPVTQPTVLRYWRENVTIHGLAYPKLTWGSSNFVSDH